MELVIYVFGFVRPLWRRPTFLAFKPNPFPTQLRHFRAATDRKNATDYDEKENDYSEIGSDYGSEFLRHWLVARLV